MRQKTCEAPEASQWKKEVGSTTRPTGTTNLAAQKDGVTNQEEGVVS